MGAGKGKDGKGKGGKGSRGRWIKRLWRGTAPTGEQRPNAAAKRSRTASLSSAVVSDRKFMQLALVACSRNLHALVRLV